MHTTQIDPAILTPSKLNIKTNQLVDDKTISRFIFVVPIKTYSTSFLFSLCTLKKGLMIIIFLESLRALGNMLNFFASSILVLSIMSYMYGFWVIPAIIAAKGIRRQSGILLKSFYYLKLFKLIISDIPCIILDRVLRCHSNFDQLIPEICTDLLLFLTFYSVSILLDIYFLYIIFCSANLILKGDALVFSQGLLSLNQQNAEKTIKGTDNSDTVHSVSSARKLRAAMPDMENIKPI